ncbi:hypothetical protein JOB18_002640 [Solea senegalensis]|uniref:Reverse transcriptase domain-containing protein n=1 Tax=Solea senegalensis TaxID=28829 RepID=A0AAV6PRJ1_SOLSE|nr:hypothetical protein JOB18_002640 [Solea senegalensis]
MGDFNAKHVDFYCNKTNSSGKVLKQILTDTNLTIVNTNEPTYISPQTGNTDILDFIICSPDLASKLHKFSTTNHLSSDHLPVLTTFSFLPQVTNKKKYNYRTAEWEKYRSNIEDKLKNITFITTHQHLDQQASLLSKILIQAREETISQYTAKSPKQTLPVHLLQLIRHKRKLRRDFIRFRSPHTKTELNRLQSTLKTQLILHRQKTWNTFYRKLDQDTNPRTFWQKIKNLNGDPQTNNTPPLKSSGIIINNNAEKAILFRNYLENIHSCPTDLHFDNEWKNLVDKEIAKHDTNTANFTTEHQLLTKPVIIQEIQLHLKKMKNKASGEDNVDTTLIKQAPATYFQHLGQLFSTCPSTGHFPSPWKVAVVIMIHKPGKDPHNTSSYRPISLLSHIGKLFERILTSRLTRHIESMGLLGIHQAGFRKGRATTDNILRLSEDIHRNFNKKEITLAIFFDIEKAFDKVWHNGLKYRLLDTNLKLPKSTQSIISSFLDNRQIKVKVASTISTPFIPQAGVPQGAVLSPLLFLIYISDIYYPPATIAKVSQFADDLCYWSSSKRPNLAAKKLQTCITEIETWTNMWRIKLNPVKTQCILFTKNSHLQLNSIDLSLNNYKITISKEATFLGVTFQNNMTWTKHINNLEQRANNRLNHLKALCGKHGASPSTVIKVYLAYIRPLFEYSVPAWINISDNQLQRLQVIQNKALKLAHRLPSYISNYYIHTITGIQTIRQRHQVIALKYMRTAINNPSLQKTIQEAYTTVDTPMSFMLQLAKDPHLQNFTKPP